jgi:hypothetical protein
MCFKGVHFEKKHFKAILGPIVADLQVYDAVVKGVVQYANSLSVGDPSKEGTYLGPLALPSQPAFLQASPIQATSS